MKFRIGFADEDRKTLHRYWDDILDRQYWSNGIYVEAFEERWSWMIGRPAVALSSWSGAAEIAMKFFELQGKVVFCPSNTFMATPFAVQRNESVLEWVDINRHDLCMSATDLAERYRQSEKKWGRDTAGGVFCVHIGGHVAFDIESIANFCKVRNLLLIEDCAHAHGAQWHGKRPGSWGDAGIYSFYATKTISTGEGAILVGSQELIDYAKRYRDYGKPDYSPRGANFRMSEFQAAVGVVSTDRLPDIVAWKNEYAEKHLRSSYQNVTVRFPDGMVSGLYKYIIFDDGKLADSTGRVYADPAHHYMDPNADLPNTEWVAKSHSCVPLYYRGVQPEVQPAELSEA